MTSNRRLRGEATFAMNNAIGSAMRTSMTVTAAATPRLRRVTVR
jgi:hypothetical protein